MATLEDYRSERLRKLQEIKDLGIDPYPAHSNRDTKISEILENFESLDQKEVTIAGRIIAIRSFGKLAFVKIRDYFGEIQLFMKQSDEVKEGLLSVKTLKLLDLGDFIEDEGRVSPEDAAAAQMLKEQIAEILGSLSEREQKVIKLRFGIGGGRPHTLEEVGAEFAVTRERIRQIEAKALSKLRKHKDTKKLHEYIH